MEKGRLLTAMLGINALSLMMSSPAASESARRSPAPVPVTCACPFQSRPLGLAANCQDACFGPEAIEAYEKEGRAQAEKERERELALTRAAEQAQQDREDELDAEAVSMVKLAEKNETASDEDLLRGPKKVRSRTRASTP